MSKEWENPTVNWHDYFENLEKIKSSYGQMKKEDDKTKNPFYNWGNISRYQESNFLIGQNDLLTCYYQSSLGTKIRLEQHIPPSLSLYPLFSSTSPLQWLSDYKNMLSLIIIYSLPIFLYTLHVRQIFQ